MNFTLIDGTIILMAVCLFLFIFLALKKSHQQDAFSERLKSLQGKNKQKVFSKTEESEKSFTDVFVGLKKTLELFFKSSQREIALKYRGQFEKAGFSTSNPAVLFVVLKTGFIALFMIAYNAMLIFSPVIRSQSELMKVLLLIIFILLGNRALNFYLSIRISNRKALISKDITAALDLLILSTNSGLSLERAFELVAEEISHSNFELGKEMAITSIELAIMPDRRQALKNLSERIELELIKDLTTTLIQSEEQGTPIAQTLRVISEEFLKKRILRVETKAQRLPVLLAVPLILFILPSLFIILMTPAIIQLMENV